MKQLKGKERKSGERFFSFSLFFFFFLSSFPLKVQEASCV